MNTSYPSLQILPAQECDLQVILDLQYLAYQSEATLLGNPKIPPLTQTLNEVKEEFKKGVILKAVGDDKKILGSVRAYSQENTLYIGKLLVHPNKQRQGIGSKLLTSIEQLFPHQRYELFTSAKSSKNITLYMSLGYTIFKEQQSSEGLTFIFLEKNT